MPNPLDSEIPSGLHFGIFARELFNSGPSLQVEYTLGLVGQQLEVKMFLGSF